MAFSDRRIACSVFAIAAFLGQAEARAAPDPTEESDKARIERLEATVADLTRRLNEREARDAARDQTVSVAAEAPRRTRGQGDHRFEVYGFAQLDAIQDFKRVNPDWEATLRPSRIPTTKGEFGSDGQTIFSVRQSRLGVKAGGTLLGKPYEAKFEFDAFGVGVDAGQTTFRLRHAYGKWGPILAGQTNTLFMDGDLFPNVVDYWGPPGMVFVRTAQLRFTFVDNKRWMAAIAAEHPSNDIDPGAIRLIDPELATNLRPNEQVPDFTAQVQYRQDWGHLTLAGILRKVAYETAGTAGNKPRGSKLGWGVNAGAVVKLSLATFRTSVVYGEGIATYMNDGGMDLAPRTALLPIAPSIPPVATQPLNELLSAKAVPLLGVSAYVDLQWTKSLSSALGYSFTKVWNTNFQEGSAFHKGEYGSGNLLWSPVERLVTGLELLWGKRTDNNGNTGDDVRSQFTFKVSFSSKDIFD
jgi:hypothetical protein